MTTSPSLPTVSTKSSPSTEALTRLAAHNPRQARVVELRYFGGLSVEQIAAILEVAPRSVKRDWSLARIFLARELNPSAALIQPDSDATE